MLLRDSSVLNEGNFIYKIMETV